MGYYHTLCDINSRFFKAYNLSCWIREISPYDIKSQSVRLCLHIITSNLRMLKYLWYRKIQLFQKYYASIPSGTFNTCKDCHKTPQDIKSRSFKALFLFCWIRQILYIFPLYQAMFKKNRVLLHLELVTVTWTVISLP